MSVYCFDSSAWIEAWTRYYPMDVLPGLWEKLDELGRAGRLVVSDEILNELNKKDDGLAKWIEDRPHFIVPLDAQVLALNRQLLADYPNLVDLKKQRSMADPFVIALAQARSATVVTQESTGTPAKPRIPFVCQSLRMNCINLLGVIRAERWRFR